LSGPTGMLLVKMCNLCHQRGAFLSLTGCWKKQLTKADIQCWKKLLYKGDFDRRCLNPVAAARFDRISDETASPDTASIGGDNIRCTYSGVARPVSKDDSGVRNYAIGDGIPGQQFLHMLQEFR